MREAVAQHAELSVIGAVLKYKTEAILSQVTSTTSFDDFEIPAARAVREAIEDMGGEFDMQTVLLRLEQKNALDTLVTTEFLQAALNAAPLPVALDEAIQSLKSFRASRAINQQTAQLLSDLGDIGGNAEQLTAHMDTYIEEVNTALIGVSKSNWESAANVADQLFEETDAPSEYIGTGFPALDAELNGGAGLGVGQMVTVAARPAHGKSTLSLDMMRHAAENGIPCLLFSMEMRQGELVKRLLGAMTHINHNSVTKWDELTDSERDRVMAAREKLREMPLYIDDRSELTIQDIRSTFARVNAKVQADGKPGIKLVTIDYIGLLSSETKFDSRQNEVAYYSRSIKIFAKDSEVCVLNVAQINRGGSKDSDVEHRPSVRELRDSGQIENDSDIILMLGKDEDAANSLDPAARGAMNIIIGKNRNGPMKDIPVTLIPHYPTFEPREATEFEEDLEEW